MRIARADLEGPARTCAGNEAPRAEAEILGGPLPPPGQMLHEAGLGGD